MSESGTRVSRFLVLICIPYSNCVDVGQSTIADYKQTTTFIYKNTPYEQCRCTGEAFKDTLNIFVFVFICIISQDT